jgi:hypothetical protein
MSALNKSEHEPFIYSPKMGKRLFQGGCSCSWRSPIFRFRWSVVRKWNHHLGMMEAY